MNRPDPIGPGKGTALRIGYGDDRDVAIFTVQRHQVRDVETAVQGGHMNGAMAPAQREVKIVGMKVKDIELIGPAVNLFQHQ